MNFASIPRLPASASCASHATPSAPARFRLCRGRLFSTHPCATSTLSPLESALPRILRVLAEMGRNRPRLSPLESALARTLSVSPLESALTKMLGGAANDLRLLPLHLSSRQ